MSVPVNLGFVLYADGEVAGGGSAATYVDRKGVTRTAQNLAGGTPVVGDEVNVGAAGMLTASVSATFAGGGGKPTKYTLSFWAKAVDTQNGSFPFGWAPLRVIRSSTGSGGYSHDVASPILDELFQTSNQALTGKVRVTVTNDGTAGAGDRVAVNMVVR